MSAPTLVPHPDADLVRFTLKVEASAYDCHALQAALEGIAQASGGTLSRADLVDRGDYCTQIRRVKVA